MVHHTWRWNAVLGLLVMLIVLAGCGSKATPTPAPRPTTPPPAVPTPPATETPIPPPTATPTTPPPAVPTATPPTPTPANASVSKSPGNAVSDSRASAASADLVARGEKIFQETAGGVGCQYCHGKDARGDVGPNIVGKPEEAIRNALGSVLQMSFIQQTTPLSDQDIQAVAAYLKSLEESQQ